MLQAQLQSLQACLADAERRVYESELIRRRLHNTIQVSSPDSGPDLFVGLALHPAALCTLATATAG